MHISIKDACYEFGLMKSSGVQIKRSFLVSSASMKQHMQHKGRILADHLTISFRSSARAAASPPGLPCPRGAPPPPRLMSAWMRALLLCTFSMSRHDPPLELRIPLRPLGSGGSPSTAKPALTGQPGPLRRLPFIATPPGKQVLPRNAPTA
ncbi:hypothetical protein EYF80_025511 [Liparis tanakae]|uniref:Uncharacterized protein n=1 Tax=Liparis tanakae TaxID=230148 RepID=A0A4Z2HFE1_9TELE|nr:hypothetical protein EYF80_025511 [Liparis tanakae]